MNPTKSSFRSRYYAEACDELQSPSPQRSAWTTQLRGNVASMANRWVPCVKLSGPEIEPQTFLTDSDALHSWANGPVRPRIVVFATRRETSFWYGERIF